MAKICITTSDTDEVKLRETDKINSKERLSIRRALRNFIPDSKRTHECTAENIKKFVYDPDCTGKEDETESKFLPDCDCSQYSSEISCFCHLFKSKPVYTEENLQKFCNVIKDKLREDLIERNISIEPPPVKPDYIIVPVLVCAKNEESESSLSSYSYYEVCECISEEIAPLTCKERKKLCGVCEARDRPIVFRYLGKYLELTSDEIHPPCEPFNLDYVGKSDEIGKWGEFLDLVDRVLLERDFWLRSIIGPHAVKNHCESDTCCNKHICVMPIRRDRFEDLDRFQYIEYFGFSRFCRFLLRWKSCVTKRWECITRKPHIVIHLPSLGYPCHLRGTAKQEFKSLQNIQIGRIGWLVNQNCQVIYVCPGKSNFETKCILHNLVKLARPDVSLCRLWIIENDETCLCKEVEEDYISGCENLFYTPKVYRRVRHLSAGRHGFIIPGVLCKLNVFIACELRTSFVGPCLNFQERLLNKHYVMTLLEEAGIQHPPFAAISNFSDLCEKMSEIIMSGKVKSDQYKWLLKVNCGFCGNQSAFISLDQDECYSIAKEDLQHYLSKVLPQKLNVNKKAYKDIKDFFVELERHGGILMPYQQNECKTVSFGCFVEHDLAKASLRTTADVIQAQNNFSCDNVGYIIPQTILPDKLMQELVEKVGDAIILEHEYIGFFGFDVVVFKNDDGELNYWVVDIDPHYTDLLSFDDWRRFCLNIPTASNFSTEFREVENEDEQDQEPIYNSDHRYVVCSGKLYIDGFSSTSNDYFEELFKKNYLGYSSKTRTGCMICPLDIEKRAFLLFSFCRKREYALKYFMRALKVLHNASGKIKRTTKCVFRSKLLDLARDLKKTYDLKDEYSPILNNSEFCSLKYT